MQTGARIEAGFQTELWERAAVRGLPMPRVRPTADADLEATFVKAAQAWARWRERQRWSGR